MTQQITVLTTLGPLLAKQWSPDDSIASYDSAKRYRWKSYDVDDLGHLHKLLEMLASQPTRCLIRGQPNPGLPEIIERNLDTFHDAPSRLLMIDCDNFEGTVEQFAATLPGPLQDVSYVWQLSGSMGHPSKAGGLRAHLWFWLAGPLTCEQSEAWCKANVPGADATVQRTVQINYTADPIVHKGVDQYAGVRLGFTQGMLGDEVIIDPASIDLTGAGAATTKRADRKSLLDPRNKSGVIGALCRAFGPYDLPRLFPEDFAPGKSRDKARFTWLKGGGTIEGLRVADSGQHVLNTHSTSPIGNRAVNLFDVIRTHVFKHLDKGVDPDALAMDPTFAPSYQATVNWAMEQQAVQAALETRPAKKATVAAEVVDSTPDTPAEPEAGDPASAEVVEVKAFKPSRNKQTGKYEATLPNLVLVLSNSGFCGVRVAYDEFRGEIALGDDGAWRPLIDADYVDLRILLERKGFHEITGEKIKDAVRSVARQHRFDSAIEWAETLQWDGVERIDSFFPTFFGMPDNPYTRSVGAYTWTALAARLMDPGAKCDMVPVFVGKQGAGKTTTVLAFSPTPEAFVEINLERKDDDISRSLRGKLVGEIAELRGLQGRDAEAIKAWVTRTHEEWTPKYQEFATRFARRLVFFGTTNSREFLADEEERRWLPLELHGEVDVAGIGAVRDQLWAEGLVRWTLDGVAWQDAYRLGREVHADFKVLDPWEEQIAEWDSYGVLLNEGFSSTWMLTKLAEKCSVSATRRLGRILRGMGFEYVTTRDGEKYAKRWRKTEK